MAMPKEPTRMSAEDAEEYTASLGQSLGGNWRMTALAVRLGVPAALGLGTEEWIERLGGHVKMAIADRKEAAEALKEEYGWSTREIGAVLGVSHATVERDLSGTNVPSIDEKDAVDADSADPLGTFVPAEDQATADPPTLDIIDLETGEIVDASDDVSSPDATSDGPIGEEEPAELPPDVVDAAYEMTDDAGRDEIDLLKFRAALFRSLKRAVDVLAYQPEHVAAALARDEKKTEVDGAIRMLSVWSKEIDSFQRDGLRLVKGDVA